MKKKYVVYANEKTSFYDTWEECKPNVVGVKGVKYKGIDDEIELQKWLLANTPFELDFILDMLELEGIEVNNIVSDSNIDKSFNIPTQKGKISNEHLIPDDALVAWVDGSINETTKEYGYGVVITKNNEIIHTMCGKGSDPDAVAMRQIFGELSGALQGINYAIDNGYKEVYIAYDYSGIEKWATGEWKAKKPYTKLYQNQVSQLMKLIDVKFIKIAAHTNVQFNEYADKLAKQGCGII